MTTIEFKTYKRTFKRTVLLSKCLDMILELQRSDFINVIGVRSDNLHGIITYEKYYIKQLA